jgi:hypothetical protein
VNVSPRVFLWISLGLHVAVGAAVYGRRAPVHALEHPPAAVASQREPEAIFHGNTFEVPVDMPGPEGDVRDEPLAVLRHADRLPPTSTHDDLRPRQRGGNEDGVNAAGGVHAGDVSTAGARGGTVFGAIRERASVDLATAFTRGFPQAASADPVWATAPYGPAGEATVVLEIDASGALVDARVDGTPGPAMRRGLDRTLALIRARTFTARQAVTRLHVSARVSPDEVHDGLHGDVFAIGGSFAAAEGQAFFALAIGRRIDLRVSE